MPQLDFDGANSRLSADNIRGQSGSTITIVSGHNLVGSGSGLTALPAANLTGTLPAISGANLTALNATQLTSGTLPMARLSGTLPALNGSALTALNATQLTSGTIPIARTLCVNRNENNGNHNYSVGRTASTITVMEIGA